MNKLNKAGITMREGKIETNIDSLDMINNYCDQLIKDTETLHRGIRKSYDNYAKDVLETNQGHSSFFKHEVINLVQNGYAERVKDCRGTISHIRNQVLNNQSTLNKICRTRFELPKVYLELLRSQLARLSNELIEEQEEYCDLVSQLTQNTVVTPWIYRNESEDNQPELLKCLSHWEKDLLSHLKRVRRQIAISPPSWINESFEEQFCDLFVNITEETNDFLSQEAYVQYQRFSLLKNVLIGYSQRVIAETNRYSTQVQNTLPESFDPIYLDKESYDAYPIQMTRLLTGQGHVLSSVLHDFLPREILPKQIEQTPSSKPKESPEKSIEEVSLLFTKLETSPLDAIRNRARGIGNR